MLNMFLVRLADMVSALAQRRLLCISLGAGFQKRLQGQRPYPFGLLPQELIVEMISMLPCSMTRRCLVVCHSWFDMLDRESLWESLCKTQWPGAKLPSCGTWREFAARGGGDNLGKELLQALKCIEATQAKCPKGHTLYRETANTLGYFCDLCGHADLPIGTVLWACTSCTYHKCPTCYSCAEALPHKLAGGATNYLDQDGWSALHHCSLLDFANVTESLIEARADVESMDSRHGITALMVGAVHGNTEVCSVLLKAGAAKATRSKQGRCALDYARLWGHADMDLLLRP